MAKTNLIAPLIWQGIPFDDPDSWSDFLGYHGSWHKVIAETLGNGMRWMNFDDLRNQGTMHQTIHDQIADRLGIPRGGDIASANLNAKDEFVNWQFVHALDHQRFRLVMGL
jgi:hypothetical protein